MVCGLGVAVVDATSRKRAHFLDPAMRWPHTRQELPPTACPLPPTVSENQSFSPTNSRAVLAISRLLHIVFPTM